MLSPCPSVFPYLSPCDDVEVREGEIKRRPKTENDDEDDEVRERNRGKKKGGDRKKDERRKERKKGHPTILISMGPTTSRTKLTCKILLHHDNDDMLSARTVLVNASFCEKMPFSQLIMFLQHV